MLPERKPLVVVGSINMDLVANTDRIPMEGETVFAQTFQSHPGGKGANQAVAIARLGYPVRMIGRLGEDGFAAELRSSLEAAGVEISGVLSTAGSSGVAMIVVAAEGENSIVVTPGANALLTPRDLEHHIGLIRSAGMVLTQLETPLDTIECLAAICARENVPLMLDPAPAAALTSSLFAQIEWFTPNETETAFYTGTTDARDPRHEARMLLKKGVKRVVLKRGVRGAYLASSAGLDCSLDAFQVKAIDTTAAGDAFNGAFATGLMLGMDPFESARFASAAAAISVTRTGAQPSMPLMSEVKQFLAAHPHMADPVLR